MWKVTWLISVYATFLIASEAESEMTKNNTCAYNVTITVDEVLSVEVDTATQTERCITLPFVGIKLFCRKKTKYRKSTKYYTNSVRKQQTMFRCCEGFVNETGVCTKAPCAFGLYGKNCTENCTCTENQYETCTMTGKCICKDGWIGENCSQACENSKYGKDCKYDCSCRNNATCSHINGNCNCSTTQGWTGERCERKCASRLYGPDCSLPCNCSNNRVCHHQTGYCSCKAGKTGDECSLNCSRLNYGINCKQQCSCDDGGTNYCDPVNGSCICKNGWMGSRCSEECQDGNYGKDCMQHCTCNEMEICDKEDGSCQLADVCVSNYTKNCIEDISVVKCDSLKDLCNDTEQMKLKKGLEKIVTELCCRDISQDYSLCRSFGNCSCSEISNGTRCEASQSMKSHQTSEKGLENEDGSAVVPAAVSSTVIIITIAVAIVVVVVIRRQRNKKRRPPVVHNQIYGASELDVVAGVIANDGHVTSSDTYDHVNRHSQRTDAKRSSNVYSSTADNRETEYDVSSRVTRNTDVNRNSNVYSSTTDTNDNEYDVSSHVRRNGDAVRNSNIYSATTNAHESEYDVSSHLVQHSSLMNGDDAYGCDHLVRGDNVGDGDTDMYDHMTRNVEEENYNTLENHI